MADNDEARRCQIPSICTECLLPTFLVVCVLLVVILIPLSFSDIEYYQIAFKQQRSTGTVFTEKVYLSGRYFVGPDFKFKTFQADAHFVEFTLQDLDIASKDKLNIKMRANMQYFLREEDLVDLNKRFDKGYEPIVQNTAKTAIKNTAKDFTTEQYRHSRELVEQALFKAVRRALGGTCCRKDCLKYQCDNECKTYSTCTIDDKGLFVDVRFFQMHDVYITEKLKGRWLGQVVEREDKEKAEFIQREQIERKKTEQKKQEIINKIQEVKENAAANVTVITAEADAKSLQFVEDARNQGLQLLYSSLNFTNEQHKASFNYLRTLRNHKNIRLHVNFASLISGPNKGS